MNAEQYAVVTGAEGPCLVLAGAGSGKTRTLIYRVAYLLEKGVRPEEILLVTFTNKAAQEMKSRVESLLKTQSKGLWCGTFHHIGNRVLRINAKSIGLEEGFGILDDEDSRDLVKACIQSLGVKSGMPAKGGSAMFSGGKFPKPGIVQNIISFAANARKPLVEVIAKNYPYLAQFAGEFEKIRVMYQEKKMKTSNLDYDDLLLRWIDLLKQVPTARERYTSQFRYCMVDEYQDTNRVQHELIKILSEKHKNLLVVGDDAQSIYSFRAAEIKNILDFPEQHDKTKVFKLETNYRSTKSILQLANHSIKHNVHQFPKVLKSVHGDGITPQFVKVRDGRQEAAFVCQRIVEMRAAGVSLSDMAVLFRAHYQAANVELELAKRGIPYLVRGGIRFFEQAHVKDVLAYLKVIQNPMDELSWIRALMLQPGIGGGYADKIFNLVEKDGADLSKVAAPEFGQNLPPRVRDGLSQFKRTFKGLLKEELKSHPDVLIEEILDKGYNKHVLLNFENAQERLEDLRQLVNFAHTYGDLKGFLADVTLREGFKGETIVETGEEKEAFDQLVLSTIHQAKGLEWHGVFIIGLSEGLFPHARSMENQDQLEEERRLFYVAATRAKEELTMIHSMTRYDYNVGTVINRPSPFIEELPSSAYDEVEVEEDDQEETIYLE